MGLGAVLDTVLSFVLIMLVLSLAVQSLMELIKRFFATKAKTMEALLAAMGESAIQSALIAMKTPPKPDATTREAAEAEQQAADAQKALDRAATAAQNLRSNAKAAEGDSKTALSKQADDAEQVRQQAAKTARQTQLTASNERMIAGVENPVWSFPKAGVSASKNPEAESPSRIIDDGQKPLNQPEGAVAKAANASADAATNPALIPWTRGRSNLTPEALKAELVRNAIAVSQALRAICTRRAEPWENAFEAAAVLANNPTAYAARVGPACVLTKDDLLTLAKLSLADLQTLLECVGEIAPAPIEMTLRLEKFGAAAANDALLNSLPSSKPPDPLIVKDALIKALKHLGAMTITQAQSLFGEYILPVRDEVEIMMTTADTAAEKFGRLLPRNVRERLYDVGRDAQQAQQAVEDWYSSWIAQFSALYEAKLKVWAFWVGLLIVICLNANALNIFQSISRSSTLRTTLTQGTQVQQITDSFKALAKQQDKLQASDVQKYQGNIDQIYQLNVVGWHITDWPTQPGLLPAWGWKQVCWGWLHFDTVLLHIGGWLLTAVLIGLGAPFWNDLFDALTAVKGRQPRASENSATT